MKTHSLTRLAPTLLVPLLLSLAFIGVSCVAVTPEAPPAGDNIQPIGNDEQTQQVTPTVPSIISSGGQITAAVELTAMAESAAAPIVVADGGIITPASHAPSIVATPVISAAVAATASLPLTETPILTPTPTVAVPLTETLSITETPGMTVADHVSATAVVTAEAVTSMVAPTVTSAVTGTEVVTTPLAVSGAITTTQSFSAAIIADRLNVRSGPSTDDGVIAKLLRGDRVPLLTMNEDESWYEVELADGGSGWISSEFAEVEENLEDAGTLADAEAVDATAAEAGQAGAGEADTEEDTEADTAAADAEADTATTFDAPTAIVQPERMNVRVGPGTHYAVMDSAARGDALPILAQNLAGDWYQVRLPEQEEPGWVYGSLVNLAGPADGIVTLAEEDLPAPPESAVPAEGAPVQAAAVNAPPPSGSGFFGYGVQAHMLGGGIDAATNATSAMGFNWIKQQIEWRLFEGSPGAIDFSELRRITDSAGARGVSVLFSVVNAPEWAREPGFDAGVGGPPADPQTYANFVGRLAGEFCGSSLQAIEVWNEQNLHYEWGNKPLNPADYMNLLRPAYASIKAACPSMLVISGAPTPAGDAGPYARDDFAYLEGMYQNGLANYADGIGAHPSGYNVPPGVAWQDACSVIQQTGNFFNGPCDTPHHSWSFRSTMEGYRNIMVVYGDANKRIWPTEFGWAAGGMFDPRYAYAEDNSFEEQAAWTVEAYQMMRGWGWVGPAFLWNLNFRVVADGSEKAQWGIVRNDYSPLPVYSALQAMAK
ncbi:MAG: SH3 domain-containing protein [Caldilineaceae bacterium]|nr:SH3 domain-containing protein [Caldilineaceae bacterium]